MRRVYYDLTGSPPLPAEVDAFVYDASPNAFERLVDKLLASRDSASTGAASGWMWLGMGNRAASIAT